MAGKLNLNFIAIWCYLKLILFLVLPFNSALFLNFVLLFHKVDFSTQCRKSRLRNLVWKNSILHLQHCCTFHSSTSWNILFWAMWPLWFFSPSHTGWGGRASQTKFPAIRRTCIFWCAMNSTITWVMPPKSNSVLSII